MQKGLGRALIAIETAGSEPYRDTIHHACRDNLLMGLYDGSRTEYVFRVIMATGKAEEYARYIGELLRQSPDLLDYWHTFELATRLVRAGQTWLQDDVYSAWDRNAGEPEDDGHISGDEDLIRMGGLAAYLRVAARIAPEIGSIGNPTGALFQFEALEEALGRNEARKQVDAAARSDVRLSSLLSAVIALRRRRARKQPRRIYPGRRSYRQIKAMIDSDPQQARKYAWRWQVRKATNRTMRKLARAALREQRPEQRTPLLKCFSERPFPFGIERLLPLVTSDDDHLARAALRIVERKRHPAVRALALDLLQQHDREYLGAALLVCNFEISDVPVLERLAGHPSEPQLYHRLALEIRQVLENNPGPHAVPALLALYENGFCSMCRSSTLDLLIGMRAVPDWMIEECRHDCEGDTRAAIAAYTEGIMRQAPPTSQRDNARATEQARPR